MFIDASTRPRPSPTQARTAYRAGRPDTAPVAVIEAHTNGPPARSTTALPNRVARVPASTLPTPATTGTASRTSDSWASLKPNFSWRTGTWVSRPAKQRPCTKYAPATPARARRSRVLATDTSGREEVSDPRDYTAVGWLVRGTGRTVSSHEI